MLKRRLYKYTEKELYEAYIKCLQMNKRTRDIMIMNNKMLKARNKEITRYVLINSIFSAITFYCTTILIIGMFG